MAKTSLKVKNSRTPKFKVRAYTRCTRCGRPHGVLRNLDYAVFALENLQMMVRFLA